jgi:ferredoxin-NADP reductase
MTGTRLEWQSAQVVAIHPETPSAKTFRLRLEHPVEHRAGQHFVVRLTAPDGYTASRSYSVASAPDGGHEIDLTVERLADGEVSNFLHDVVVVGDELEVRGPIGSWFVWDAAAPATLVGGGSGVVPLMAMLRLARRMGREDLLRLVVSVRRPDDLYYANEIAGPQTTLVYTRTAPSSATRAVGRLGATDFDAAWLQTSTPFVCGSPGFCDGATNILTALAVPANAIRVERFGPSG